MRECWGYKKLLKVCEKMKGKTSEKTEKTKEDQVGKMETDVWKWRRHWLFSSSAAYSPSYTHNIQGF